MTVKCWSRTEQIDSFYDSKSSLYCDPTSQTLLWHHHRFSLSSSYKRHTVTTDTAQKYTVCTVEISCFHLRTRSTGLFHLFEVNILLMWQHLFTSQLSFCLCSSRWVQVKTVRLHPQPTDGLCWELCLCIDEALFSNLNLLLWDEMAIRWSLAVIYKTSISVVPNIAGGVLAMPLSWQLFRGFQASLNQDSSHLRLGVSFQTVEICIWEQIMFRYTVYIVYTHTVYWYGEKCLFLTTFERP